MTSAYKNGVRNSRWLLETMLGWPWVQARGALSVTTSWYPSALVTTSESIRAGVREASYHVVLCVLVSCQLMLSLSLVSWCSLYVCPLSADALSLSLVSWCSLSVSCQIHDYCRQELTASNRLIIEAYLKGQVQPCSITPSSVPHYYKGGPEMHFYSLQQRQVEQGEDRHRDTETSKMWQNKVKGWN